MEKLALMLLMVLGFHKSQAIGPYYANVCGATPTTLTCPGDTLMTFNAMIYTQYKLSQEICGAVTTTDTTSRSLCSTTIYQSGDTGNFVQQFNQACTGRTSCTLNFYVGLPFNGPCTANNTDNVVRVVYSCNTPTGTKEAFVCSDFAGTNPITQSLICPANKIIVIENIMAVATGGGSLCTDYIGTNDFTTPCSYSLAPSHFFYREVVTACTGKSICSVTGQLIDNAQNCATQPKRNYERIYYSCVTDQSQKVTVCANAQTTVPQLNCGSAFITITNVIADRLHNGATTNCPSADAISNFNVAGCTVGVKNTDPVGSIISKCNGKTACTLTSLPAYTAYPCGSDQLTARNWFSISYQCSKSAGLDGYITARACTGSDIQLKCPASTVISVSLVYATVLFATGTFLGDYSCPTALAVGNSELASCNMQLASQGNGSPTYNMITSSCNGNAACNVTVSNSLIGNTCFDENLAVGVVRSYTARDLFVVQYTCTTPGAASSTANSTGSSVNALGLGLGLAALFIVLIIIVVAVVLYKRRNRESMTTKLSTPTASSNYSNF